MVDITLLNLRVLGAVRMRLGCEESDDESHDGEIATMSEMEVFGAYLTWSGIIGYEYEIWSAVESIKAATE